MKAPMDKQRLLVLSLLLLLTFCIAVWYFVDIEWERLEIDVGYSDEAVRKPFLAAEQFLGKMGVEAESWQGLSLVDELPPPSDVLVITTPRLTLSQRRTRLLLDWVDRGGSLVVVAATPFDYERGDSGDMLLDQVGIYLSDYTSEDEKEDQATAGNYDQQSEEESEAESQDFGGTFSELVEQFNNREYRCDKNIELTPVFVEGEEEPLEVSWQRPGYYLMYQGAEASAWASNSAGVQFLVLSRGEGELAVMSEINLWRNHRIACDDNAALLYLLVSTPAKVWLLYNEESPSLFTLLWRHSPALVYSSLVLLALWLWSQTLRYGPLRIESPPQRRRFVEHLEASARYAHNLDNNEAMIASMRAEIFQRITLHHPGFNSLALHQQRTLLVTLTGLETQVLDFALKDKVANDHKSFVAQIGLLQTIRKQL